MQRCILMTVLYKPGMSAREIADVLFRDNPRGVPATGYIRVGDHIHRINRLLEPHGITIRSGHRSEGYKVRGSRDERNPPVPPGVTLMQQRIFTLVVHSPGLRRKEIIDILHRNDPNGRVPGYKRFSSYIDTLNRALKPHGITIHNGHRLEGYKVCQLPSKAKELAEFKRALDEADVATLKHVFGSKTRTELEQILDRTLEEAATNEDAHLTSILGSVLAMLEGSSNSEEYVEVFVDTLRNKVHDTMERRRGRIAREASLANPGRR
jgi:hypothetical protein